MKRISSINALFWGLLIIFIDINIGDFDILNDILGFFIIIYGLYKLKDFSKSFLKGFYLAQIINRFFIIIVFGVRFGQEW